MSVSKKAGRLRFTRAGFSFLEIMMVVMIIGIMLAFVGPRLVGKTKKAKVTAAKRDLAGIETALGLYEMYMGDFPANEDGLEALVEKPSGAGDDWEQCMQKVPTDPWGNEFVYKFPGEHGDYDLVSTGPDGKEGTDDDITNYEDDEG